MPSRLPRRLRIDELLKQLSRSLPSQNANEALTEISPAIAALPLMGFHNQAAAPYANVAVAHFALVAAFVAQFGALATWA